VAGTLFTPRNLGELVTAVRWARDNAADFYVLGGGSNVLISDGVIETPVILTTGMADVAVRVSGEFVYLDCMSGAQLKNVLSLSVRNGWSGLECAAGIPGTVGGAVAGNAGTSQGFVGAAVERITTVEEDGSVAEWHGREIDWAYRYCSLFTDAKRAAHEVTFRLRVTDDKSEVAKAMKSAMSGRKSQPVMSRTAGCVFRNPDGDSAGRLLDASGCKGMSVGGAKVSEAHANFIENDGSCTARDILILAEMCKKRVWEAFGTTLGFEVKFFGISEVCAYATA
jgi:UDP-N-acetylmuramate dehydrogenase